MTLDELIADIKRRTQYGNPSATGDQAAIDILNSINDNINTIVTDWDWEWLFKAITISLVPGTTDYTLDADVSELLGLGTADGTPISIISFKDYYKYYAPTATDGASIDGSVFWGMYIGRDAAGSRKIRLGNIPSSATTLSGFAKKTVGEFDTTDLGDGTSLLPFPEEGESTLKEFVIADVYALQGKKDLIFPQKAEALRKLKAWRSSTMTDSIQDVKSGVPPYLRDKKINRRNGNVV
jgi:hypothetical protein